MSMMAPPVSCKHALNGASCGLFILFTMSATYGISWFPKLVPVLAISGV